MRTKFACCVEEITPGRDLSMHVSDSYSSENQLESCRLLSTPIPNPSAVFKEDGDGWGMLVNLDTAAAMALNPTGLDVWKLIDGRHEARDIVAALRDQFKNIPSNVDDDVTDLLSVLAEEGMIGYEVVI